jgi:hypothetical protein
MAGSSQVTSTTLIIPNGDLILVLKDKSKLRVNSSILTSFSPVFKVLSCLVQTSRKVNNKALRITRRRSSFPTMTPLL